MSKETANQRGMFWGGLALSVTAFLVLVWMVLPNILRAFQNPAPQAVIGYPGETSRARVVRILEEGPVTLGQVQQTYRLLEIEILDGKFAGQVLPMEYGRRYVVSASVLPGVGDELLIWAEVSPVDGTLNANFVDFVRGRGLLLLLILFVAFSILISGWKGLRSLLGIGLSLMLIIFYILPNILDGRDPVWTSIVGAFVFLSISLYMVYGWTVKTHAAVLGTAIALTITGLLALFAVNLTRLTGLGDENAMFLMQQASATIDLRGLLLAGILIGSLGVLDDLVIGQASAVFELHAANDRLTLRMLYRRAMNIGRDHVAATVNTMVLAYTGAALPMLLLFSLNSHNYGLLINNGFIAEEIVRTLVGSIGLFAAVPITTFLACLLALHRWRLGRLASFLGPDNSWDQDSVFHSH